MGQIKDEGYSEGKRGGGRCREDVKEIKCEEEEGRKERSTSEGSGESPR